MPDGAQPSSHRRQGAGHVGKPSRTSGPDRLPAPRLRETAADAAWGRRTSRLSPAWISDPRIVRGTKMAVTLSRLAWG